LCFGIEKLEVDLGIVNDTKDGLGANFNRLWSASLASNFADGILKTAAPLLAATLTQDPLLISLMAALVMLPWLFFAIPVGAMVDRVDRRLALALANSSRFLVAAALAFAVATGSITIWWLFLAAFLIGIAEVVYDTTTQSMIPQMVPAPKMDRANSRLQSAEILVANFVGAPASGILYAVAIFIPFVVNSAGILLAIVLVLMIPKSFSTVATNDADKGESLGVWADIKFGIRYLLESTALRSLVIQTTIIGFAFAISQATMVLYLLEVQNVPVAAFGFVMMSFGVGAFIGSIAAPKLAARFGAGVVLATVNISAGLLMIAVAFAPSIWFVLPLLVLMGSTSGTWNVLLMSLYHRLIPNHLFGRIHGTRRTLIWGMMPIGSLVGGVVALVDLRLPFLAGGIIATAMATIYARFLKQLAG
jgi:MFS family permease